MHNRDGLSASIWIVRAYEMPSSRQFGTGRLLGSAAFAAVRIGSVTDKSEQKNQSEEGHKTGEERG